MPHRLYKYDRPDNKSTNFYLTKVYYFGDLVGVSKNRKGNGNPNKSNHIELNNSFTDIVKKHCEKKGIEFQMTKSGLGGYLIEGASFQLTSIMENENGDHFYMEWMGDSVGYKRTLVNDKINSFKYSASVCPTCKK